MEAGCEKRMTGGIDRMNTIKKRELPGAADMEPQAYEASHRLVARKAAAQGFVLLKNEDNVLPLRKDKTVALYGEGAVHTIKGGTGSGDVNARETVNIREGLKNAGYRIMNGDWLDQFEKAYADGKSAWRDEIWEKYAESDGSSMDFFNAYSSTAMAPVISEPPAEKVADTAIFVVARNAGEGADRFNAKGDYLLRDDETEFLARLDELYSEIILLVNTGGLIDLGFLDHFDHIKAVMYLHQPGMEAGNAAADVLSGEVTPSGKLTDSWAFSYADYPCADTFSHNNGDVAKELYSEGIFIGYRYFDAFDIPVRYGFGYGLSYTTFDIRTIGVSHIDLGTGKPKISVRVCVTNTGGVSGKEVVQIYASCPQGRLVKEVRRLVAYRKTKELAPGETQEMDIPFPMYLLSSYDAALPGYVLEKGEYILLAGNSLESAKAAAVVRADDELVIAVTENICRLSEELEELVPDAAVLEAKRNVFCGQVRAADLPVIGVHTGDVVTERIAYTPAYEDTPQEVRDFVDTLSMDELILLATGDIAKGQGAEDSQIGNAGTSVPGSAAETAALSEKGLAGIVLADGPAGLRLNWRYPVRDGAPQSMPFYAALEGGYLAEGHFEFGDDLRYQFTTAIPAGTNLAMSWDPEIVRECGVVVADEMERFGVALWLAPGMNIHRNPLCGRNFEYYSEDPVISGTMAAAMTEGVQSVKGCGTTIKHLFANNSEDNRMGVDCIISERAIREIYLKGFEIAVKTSQPMAVMTSYNMINGIHAANNYDSCTKALRNEWGFHGLVMTDWMTTTHSTAGECTASGCMRAGNDIVMPGAKSDHANLREEFEKGTLKMEDLKRSAARVVNCVWNCSALL